MSVTAAGLALTGVALAMALAYAYVALRPRADDIGRGAAVLITILAPALLIVLTVLPAQARMGDILLTLPSVRVRLDDGPLRIGGGREVDDLSVATAEPFDPNIHPGALRLFDNPQGAEVRFYRPGPGPASGLVEAGEDEERRILGSVPIGPDQPVCIGRRTVTVSADQSRLLVDGREGRLTMAFADPAHDVLAVRHLAAMSAADLESGPLAASRTVLFRRGGELRAALLDANARPAGAAGCAAGGAAQAYDRRLASRGERLHLEFFAIAEPEAWRVAEQLAADPGASAPAGRLIDRRGLALIVGTDAREGSVIAFDTPEAKLIQRSAIDAALSTPAPLFDSGVRLAFGGLGRTAGSPRIDEVVFRSLGDRTRANLYQRLEVDREPGFLFTGEGCGPAASAAGAVRRAFGETLCLQTAGVSPLIRVERLDQHWPPLRYTLVLPIAALLCGLASTRRWRAASPFAFVILSLADLLLSLRLLIAIEGAVIDPAPGAIASVTSALGAMAVVPFALALLQRSSPTFKPERGDVPVLAVHGLLVAGALVLLLLQSHAPWRMLAPYGLILGAAGLAAIPAVASTASRWGKGLIDGLGAAFTRTLAIGEGRLASLAWLFWPLSLAVLAMAVRLATPARIPGLGNTSFLFTPVAVLLGAWAFHRLVRATQDRADWTTMLIGATGAWLAAALPLLGALREDRGYIIVHVLPLLVWAVLLSLWLVQARWPLRSALALPGFVAAVLAASLVASPALWPAPQWPAPTDNSDTARDQRIAFVGRALAAQRFEQRLEGYVAPERLEAQGTLQATQTAAGLHQALEYSSQGLFGRGYINQPRPTELRRYHLDDNVPAVHLFTPFGRLAVAMLCVTLMAAFASCLWRVAAAGGGKAPTMAQAIALLSLCTFVGVSLYMVLANLRLLPFTGRNMYLLSPISPVDLVEGTLLLGMSLFLLERRTQP